MSNKRKKYEKHPYSVRLQVVAKVLCEHLPLRTTGKMFDVNPRQVKYWVSLYSRYGEEGLRMQHRYYPVDFKYKVLQDVFENHLSLQEAALKYEKIFIFIHIFTAIGKKFCSRQRFQLQVLRTNPHRLLL